MAYVKNNWVDREGTTRYFETVDDDGALILTPDYTQVTEMGTPVNADNMNHIEEGIAAGSFTKYDSMATYAKNDLVTTIVDNELKVYKSLQDNNTDALDNSSFWEEVEFSGGSGAGLQLFDTIIKDHVLTYEETKGLALQGSYVYKEAVAGSRYGYSDFYNKVIEEYDEATNTETINGVTVKVHSNGHKFYDIADKTAIDNYFNSMGSAWFYGVDIENERIFLPRNNKKIHGELIESSINGTNWYRVYSDGWCEQGFRVDAQNQSEQRAYNLLKPMINTNYSAMFTENSGTNGCHQTKLYATSTTQVTVATPSGGGMGGGFVEVRGYTTIEQPIEAEKYTYICVGNTTNYEGMTDVVNQGMDILEQVAQSVADRVKIDGSNAEFPYITECYVNGMSGYNLYSNGYCEQWGYAQGSGATVILLKPMQNNSYNINLGGGNSAGWGNNSHSFTFYNVTSNSFQIRMEEGSTLAGGMNCYWTIRGYAE